MAQGSTAVPVLLGADRCPSAAAYIPSRWPGAVQGRARRPIRASWRTAPGPEAKRRTARAGFETARSSPPHGSHS